MFRYSPASIELAAVILAALGLDDLLKASVSRRRLLATTVGSLAVLLAAVIAARGLTSQLGAVFNQRPYFAGSVVWAAGIMLRIAAAGVLRHHRARSRWQPG